MLILLLVKQDVNAAGYKQVYILLRDYFHTLAPGTAYIFTQNYRPSQMPYTLIRMISEHSGITGNTVFYPATVVSTAFLQVTGSHGLLIKPSELPYLPKDPVVDPSLLFPWGSIDLFHLYHRACFPGEHLANDHTNQREEPR